MKVTQTTTSPPAAPHYDLRREGIILVTFPDGSRVALGIEAALVRAHEWSAIHDPLSTTEFGLYRLLVAFALDIFAPTDSQEWSEIWQAGQFDERRIASYFEAHEGRFDLFGPAPFLQCSDMDGEKAKPLAGLFAPVPSGTGANLFHHQSEDDFGVCPAVAARLLATIAPFMTAGGAGLSPSINGAPPLYVLPLGQNGFQTLLLNLPFMADLLREERGAGPTWLAREPVKAERATSASLLQSLTWRPRKICLVAGEGGVCSLTGEISPVLVRAMKFSPGWGTGFDWIDPNCAYRIGDERTVIRLREGRELWRDTGPLALLQGDKQKYQRPAVISQISELGKENYFDASQPLDLLVYGVRTDMKMKVFEWQREHLSVPLTLLWREVEGNWAQEEMERAEKVAYQLRRAIKAAYPREAQGNDKAFDSLANSAARLYWRSLRGSFDDLLRLLATRPDDETRNAALENWRHALRDQGRAALQFAIEDFDGDGRALERQTNAYSQFSRAIWPIIEPQKFEEAKAKRPKK